jgi:uncharacterized protein
MEIRAERHLRDHQDAERQWLADAEGLIAHFSPPTPDRAMTDPSLRHAAGVGFKPEHFSAICDGRQNVGFFEVHAENYMGAGGPPHAQLTRLRQNYSLSVHGVGLSIGGKDPLDLAHLDRLKLVCDRYQPALVSEHLAWSSHGTNFYNDLLPLPLTEATLARVIQHVEQVQETLRRKVLIENPATYLRFGASTIPETEFLAELSRRTGCGLLLDINNIYVSAVNHGFDAEIYLEHFAVASVGEIHLAGHSVTETADGGRLLVDTHGEPIADPVFALYEKALARIGAVATLIERDNDVPAWDALVDEATKATRLLAAAKQRQCNRERAA